MDIDRPLPLPDSLALDELGITGDHRLIYNYLYSRRENPPTMSEIRAHVREIRVSQGDEFEAAQLDRRKRDLHKHFRIEAVTWNEVRFAHRLLGWSDRTNQNAHVINRRVRFQVLESGRCVRCGRAAEADDVKLVVDHIVPQAWGGTNDLSNLQPLCEECNGGKKDYYGAFDRYAPQIRLAVGEDEPHRRIAALLDAFDGEWVPSDLVGAVASAKQYQEDWQKRLRELRYFDWVIEVRSIRQRGKRAQVFYRATERPTLPSGKLAEITRRTERERSQRKAMKQV